jgi:hypothetical protein
MIRTLLSVALLVSGAMLARSQPVPELELATIIGDGRGRSIEPVDVGLADDGTVHLLMRNGRVAVFDRDGGYLRSLRSPGATPGSSYLASRGMRIFLGDDREDFPWVFEERRQGDAPGYFNKAGRVVADDRRIYVADRGNNRLQVFARENTDLPVAILDLDAQPVALTVRDRLLAVADNQRKLSLYEMADDGFSPLDSFRILDGATSLAIAVDGAVFVAYHHGHNHSLRKYARKADTWSEARIIAPSLHELWPDYYPNHTPFTLGPDNQVWFGTDLHGAVLSLDPETDRVAARLTGLHRPLALGFDSAGVVYVGGYPRPGQKGPEIRRFAPDGKDLGLFGPDVLYPSTHAPIWALLPAPDGGLYARIVESGYRKGWPAFTLKKVDAAGTAKTILDLGSLFAVRTRFHPTSSIGNFVFDRDGNLIAAVSPYLAVLKLSPKGDVIWEASQYPKNADKIPFGSLGDVAIDSRNNIWVTDHGRHALVCLSSEGKLLLTHGGPGDIDDRSGQGFAGPMGIAAVIVGDEEFLYVGDAGNHRILKYRLRYRD